MLYKKFAVKLESLIIGLIFKLNENNYSITSIDAIKYMELDLYKKIHPALII